MKKLCLSFMCLVLSTPLFAGFSFNQDVTVTRTKMADYLKAKGGNSYDEMAQCSFVADANKLKDIKAADENCVVTKGTEFKVDHSDSQAPYRKDYEFSCVDGLLKSVVIDAVRNMSCASTCSVKYPENSDYVTSSIINRTLLSVSKGSVRVGSQTDPTSQGYDVLGFVQYNTTPAKCIISKENAARAFLNPIFTTDRKILHVFYPVRFSVTVPSFTHDAYYNKFTPSKTVKVELALCDNKSAEEKLNGCRGIKISGTGVTLYDAEGKAIVNSSASNNEVTLAFDDLRLFNGYGSMAQKLPVIDQTSCTRTGGAGAVINNINADFGFKSVDSEGTDQLTKKPFKIRQISLVAWAKKAPTDRCGIWVYEFVRSLFSNITVMKDGQTIADYENIATVAMKDSRAYFTGDAKDELASKVTKVDDTNL